MVTAVRCVISKLLWPLWRRAEVEEFDGLYGADAEEIRHVRKGLVTHLCQDYGLIDGDTYFDPGQVLGGAPVEVGAAVNAIAVRDGAEAGWRAVRVERYADAWEEDGGTSVEHDFSKLRPLIGTVTSCDKDGGFINQTMFFPRSALCEGFEPMKGDWVQAQFFISPTQWSSQAHSVAPLRYRRMDQVRVSGVFGNGGVVEDCVFFTLDSLKLPSQYKPQPGDLVSLVVVESNQSLYSWRALCMAPTENGSVPSTPIPESELQTILQNKEGLVVSEKTDVGHLFLGEGKEMQVWIMNQGSEHHKLERCEFAGWDAEEQFTFRPAHADSSPGAAETGPVGRLLENVLEIAPGEKVSVLVGCYGKNVGRCAELLLLHFHSFTIGRRLEVEVSSRQERLLHPSAPYNPAGQLLPQKKPQQQQPNHVVTVTAPPLTSRMPKRHLPNFLQSYPVPQALRDCVEAKGDVLVTQPQLGEPLSMANMQSRFSVLLWLEELQAELELREFRISDALLRKGTLGLHLEVPGLAEGRPSLFIGDKVVLKKNMGGLSVVEYLAYVTEINDEDVSLRVNSEFHHSYLGEPLDVEFTYNRLTMRRCHNAIDWTKGFGETVLFPTRVVLQAPQWDGEWLSEQPLKEGEEKIHAKEHEDCGINNEMMSMGMVSVATQTRTDQLQRQAIPSPGQFFNPKLNPAQKEAVKRVLAGECRPTPYILFGPPGTGKTITLIEIILQVFHRLPYSRMLVCTPSNSAADLICVRLHDSGYLNVASLARVNATCRPEGAIPEVLRQYSRAGEDIRHASYHRIVVTTCSSAGMFYQIGLRIGHFTHGFLDEAGQATEPESLIPLGLLSGNEGQIVLAGDPRQLGPVIKSKVASAFGLGLSLLERLMATPLYSSTESGYNPVLVTKLVYNYRSHEALLSLPSRLFYSGELCMRAERAVVGSLCHWSCLPTKGFPLIFHGVRGNEMRESSNPSWFNPAEAVQVMMYCCQLAKKLYNPVKVADIGIIAPYKKQVEKIRLLLHKVGLGDIKVGSVEEFQGQEFLVIILSMVRSNETNMDEDNQSVLGFLSNPKRFNVAITRSKALLIVVGNPHVLMKDLCFSALLHYAYENGALVGCDPPVALRSSQRSALRPLFHASVRLHLHSHLQHLS
ncbi:RNA helicase Mov10l1, partial [Denticeps clupeoides]|uniref:RNA helicase Mov10l1 n=1 Tax=Denticeps clupeoides TaxID=299321 RepID=UPI0010A3880A